MEPKRILIVDDEKIARDRVERFLLQTGRELSIQQASNGIEAVDLIGKFQPHCVFLDVQMPGLTGFEVLHQLEIRDFHVIFQTAYDAYALKAFDESAVDYLLKPFTFERFQKALEKALAQSSRVDDLERLEKHQQRNNDYLSKIVSRQGGRLKVFSVDHINSFVSSDHCTSAFTSDGEVIIDLSIAFLSDHLDPRKFMRCHRKSIVAIDRIKTVGSVVEPHLELMTGQRVPLSRSNRPIVIERLSQR